MKFNANLTTGSFRLSRRTLLRASGVSLALPWLEVMADSGKPKGHPGMAGPPKRFCAFYFPFGVSLPGKDNPAADWRWFPDEAGPEFRFNKSLEGLEPLRDQLTVIGGLHHPHMAKRGGHDSGDTFLTGADIGVNLTTGAAVSGGAVANSVSVDQVMARELGNETRFRSLVLSTDGGVGTPARATTLSFDSAGIPIPAWNRPQSVFERLFGVSQDSIRAQRRSLKVTGSHLDLLLGEARALNRRLGKADQERVDEYLSSVRQVEQQVQRSVDWLDVPKPEVNATGLTLDANHNTPLELIRTMLDLIVLALRTDSTRFVTYQFANMHGAGSIAGKFPGLLGFSGGNMHALAHGWNKPGGAERLGKWDRWNAENLRYFLGKLAGVQEGDGTLLDNTLVLYGSSNSTTHTNFNYPLILAGGGPSMGFTHGQYLRCDHGVPLSNLYLTMLRRIGVPAESFADSSGELEGV